ncbi:hypothetical protein HYPSUDRAFT_151159, partial [Hypholoma sublateritium FD-334 SS-4]
EPDDLDDVAPTPVATLEDLKVVQQFIDRVRNATLDNDCLPDEVIARLRNAPTETFHLDEQDPLRTALELFLATVTASEAVFDKSRNVIQRTLKRKLGEDCDIIPSLYQVKERIKEITGVYPLMHDMCPNTCIAYTGPFSELDTCPKCDLPRYNPQVLATSGGVRKIPQRRFVTLPVGPQLQALWRTPEGAQAMRYRQNFTKSLLQKAANRPDKKVIIDEYEDIFHGAEYLDAVCSGAIKDNDMVLMMSIDGAQLYESKQSDCWIYIWIVLDLAPEVRYKKRHIFPGGFFPGPNKPGNIESFLFPGFHHVSALMKEGLSIWDASENKSFISKIFILLGLADGPGLTYLNGLTGHSGAYGCRLYCSVKGRRREGGNHYYPAHLKPENYSVDGCDHEDVNIRHLPIGKVSDYLTGLNTVLGSRTQAEHQRYRKMTGISRPSIFSAFERTLSLPRCFGGDLMHLVLNLIDLLLALWRGTMECDPTDSKHTWGWLVLVGDVWKIHGQRVADCTPYLPGSFDRPPRNPAEKISSGYKAWECLTYLFGLGPGLFHGILPTQYWKNYCKLVSGFRLLHQRTITTKHLVHSHSLLLDFVTGFEELYYQRKSSRIHFCRQSVHAVVHIPTEVFPTEVPRLGPGCTYTQWPMERSIGNLTEEIKQHSQPYANLAEHGAQRAQVNALVALVPDLEQKKPLSHLSKDIGNSFILSMADTCARSISAAEMHAIQDFYLTHNIQINPDFRLVKWGRLLLPNLQFVRTAWKEAPKALNKVRISRNIMVSFQATKNYSHFELVFSVLQKYDDKKPIFWGSSILFSSKNT